MTTQPDTPHGPPPVRAIRITHDGILEVVHVRGTRDAIAAAVDGVGPSDVAAKATWRARGGSILTAWQAASAPRSRQNELAERIVDELLPRLPEGVPDRLRTRLLDEPLAGPVLILGYRPAGEDGPWGENVSLSDLDIDRIRSLVDGRRARREAATLAVAASEASTRTVAVDQDAPTVALAMSATTTLNLMSAPAAAVFPPARRVEPQTGGVEALAAKLAAAPPARQQPRRKGRARRGSR
jgi:hypothetical protein